MRISLIAAMTSNRIIGRNNDLPWHLPDDMKYFQTKTKGHIVVMGRKNYDSLPSKFKPLPNRTNVILTRNAAFEADGCLVFDKMDDAIAFAKNANESELFIIGGGEVYKESIHLADRVYLTEINTTLDGDTHFPEIDEDWSEVSREHHAVDNKHTYSFDFVVYEKS